MYPLGLATVVRVVSRKPILRRKSWAEKGPW
jgi:hypothetical protein